MGTLSINMAKMDRWQVNSDNVRLFDSIHVAGGKFFTLDAQPYINLLCEFNIFYTFKDRG